MGNSIINGFMDAVLGFLMAPPPLGVFAAPFGCAPQTLGAPKSPAGEQSSQDADVFDEAYYGPMTCIDKCESACVGLTNKIFAGDAGKVYFASLLCVDNCGKDPDPCKAAHCMKETDLVALCLEGFQH